MGYGDCGGPARGESRRIVGERQGAKNRGSQAADGKRGQGETAFGLRRDYSQEAEIFELCADCVYFGEDRRSRGKALSVDRSGGGGTEEKDFDSGAESLVKVD